jgi:hypothetical protein
MRLFGTTALSLLAAAAVTAFAAPAAAAISQVQVVDVTSTVGVASSHEATATCPGAMKVAGAGVTNTGLGQVVVDVLRPETRSVYAHAFTDGTGFTGIWSLTVRAICVPDNEVAFHEVTGVTSNSDSLSPKSETSTCPGGKDLIGMGWSISGASGQVTVTEVIPSRTFARVKAYEDDDGTTAAWSLTTYRICASTVTGLEIRTSSTTANSNVSQGKSQTCPAGKVGLGGGANVVGGSGNIVLNNLWPGGHYAGVDLMNATAREDEDGTTGTWHVTLNLICADG